MCWYGHAEAAAVRMWEALLQPHALQSTDLGDKRSIRRHRGVTGGSEAALSSASHMPWRDASLQGYNQA
eukprot:353206-Chlamydomonas_euryale.AAC.8